MLLCTEETKYVRVKTNWSFDAVPSKDFVQEQTTHLSQKSPRVTNKVAN